MQKLGVRRIVLSLLLASWEIWLSSGQAQERTFSVAPESSLTILVGRAGVLRGLGHEHIVTVKSFTGEVRISPDEMSRAFFLLEANANELSVVDEGISDKERKEIQNAMESKVLEVSRFPKISFRSVSLSNIKPSTNGQTLTINGDLALHGVTNRIAVPVTMAIAPEQLLVTGETAIKQTDFGIKPYAAAGGTIKVKDALRISFAITARSSKASAR